MDVQNMILQKLSFHLGTLLPTLQHAIVLFGMAQHIRIVAPISIQMVHV